VPGGVDYVKAVALPETGGSSRLDGNAALSFLVHEIHGGGTFVHLAEFVDFAGELEDSFGGRGLSRINMRENSDISI